jgi:hypothetical protein
MNISRRDLAKLSALALPFAHGTPSSASSVAQGQMSVALLMRGLFILSDDTTPDAEGEITNGTLRAYYLKVGQHVPLLTLDVKTLAAAPWDLLVRLIVAPDGTEYGVFDVSGLTLTIKDAAPAALAFKRSKNIDACPPTDWNDLFYVVSIPSVKSKARNLRRPGKRSSTLEMSSGRLTVRKPAKEAGGYRWQFQHKNVTHRQFATDQIEYETPAAQAVTIEGRNSGGVVKGTWTFSSTSRGSLVSLPLRSSRHWEHVSHLCEEFDGDDGCPTIDPIDCQNRGVTAPLALKTGVDVAYCPPGKRP